MYEGKGGGEGGVTEDSPSRRVRVTVVHLRAGGNNLACFTILSCATRSLPPHSVGDLNSADELFPRVTMKFVSRYFPSGTPKESKKEEDTLSRERYREKEIIKWCTQDRG